MEHEHVTHILMTTFNLFHSLPCDVISSILNEWIADIYNLCSLDAALGHQESRHKFLTCLQSVHCKKTLKFPHPLSWNYFKKWNKKRNYAIIFHHLTISRGNLFMLSELAEFLPTLRRLCLFCDNENVNLGYILPKLSLLVEVCVSSFLNNPSPVLFTAGDVTSAYGRHRFLSLQKIYFSRIRFSSLLQFGDDQNEREGFFSWLNTHCPNFSSLQLQSCYDIHLPKLISYLERFPRLETFLCQCADCPMIIPDKIEFSHPTVRHFTLETNDIILGVSLNCPQLYSLSLILSKLMSMEELGESVTSWTKLKKLSLALPPDFVSDYFLFLCGQSCHQLTNLSLYDGTFSLSLKSYAMMGQQWPQLQSLEIFESVGIRGVPGSPNSILANIPSLSTSRLTNQAISTFCDSIVHSFNKQHYKYPSSNNCNNLRETITSCPQSLLIQHHHFIPSSTRFSYCNLESICLFCTSLVTIEGFSLLFQTYASYFRWKLIKLTLTKQSIPSLTALETLLDFFVTSSANSTVDESLHSKSTGTCWSFLEILEISIVDLVSFADGIVFPTPASIQLTKPWQFQHPTIRELKLAGIRLWKSENFHEIRQHCPKLELWNYFP